MPVLFRYNGASFNAACLLLPELRLGDVTTHTDDPFAGNSGPSVFAWTSPIAGIVNITGAVWLLRDIGRYVDWSVKKNGMVLTAGTVYSGDPYDRACPFAFAAGSGGSGALQHVPVNVGDEIVFEATMGVSRGQPSPFGDEVGVEFAITVGVPASCTCRNGSGINPTGFECTSRPVVGGNWSTNVLVDSSTAATFVGLSTSGSQQPFLGGEILIGLSPPPVFTPPAMGAHTVPIPNASVFTGLPLSTQGFRIDVVGGVPGVVLLNAQDLVLGF